MRNITFLLLTIFITSLSFGQNFPEKDVNLLLNKKVKPKEVKESMQRYLYKNFYKKYDITKKKLDKYNSKAHIFPSGTYNSDYNKLVGVEFTVVKIYPTEKEKYFVLELENEKLGTIYYDYDTKYDFNFELTVVGGLDLPKDFYCKKIEKKEDKFTNKVSYSTPTKSGFTFYKDNDKVYMSVRERGSTANVGKTGLIILFDNGTKIEKGSAKIDVKVNSGGSGYMYSAFVELAKSDIEKLRNNLITDDRLYIYDGTVKTDDAKIIQEYVKCLTDI